MTGFCKTRPGTTAISVPTLTPNAPSGSAPARNPSSPRPGCVISSAFRFAGRHATLIIWIRTAHLQQIYVSSEVEERTCLSCMLVRELAAECLVRQYLAELRREQVLFLPADIDERQAWEPQDDLVLCSAHVSSRRRRSEKVDKLRWKYCSTVTSARNSSQKNRCCWAFTFATRFTVFLYPRCVALTRTDLAKASATEVNRAFYPDVVTWTHPCGRRSWSARNPASRLPGFPAYRTDQDIRRSLNEHLSETTYGGRARVDVDHQLLVRRTDGRVEALCDTSIPQANATHGEATPTDLPCL
jgi:hypothetical protein